MSTGGVGKGFRPHRSYYGWVDSLLGINLFWSEKFFIFISYCQRLALLLLWDLKWPTQFFQRLAFMYGFLLDLTAHHQDVEALGARMGAGGTFEGCEAICKVVWPVVCMSVLGLWAMISLIDSRTLYFTRNLERVLWAFVRIGLLPYMNTLLRYFILNEDGNLTNRKREFVTPVSEIGIFFAVVTFLTFVVLAYIRSAKQVLFKSQIRHDAFIRARELEYMLRFSCMYRNERLWMISSYTYEAWPWSIVRGVFDIALLVTMVFIPTAYGVYVGAALFFVLSVYAFFVAEIHRCKSSNAFEHIGNVTLFVFMIFGILQVNNVRMALLVDSNLDYFLFGLHGFAGFLFVVCGLYFFGSGHVLGLRRSQAEKRAHEKWKRTFVGEDGDIELAEQSLVVPEVDEDEARRIEQEEFVKVVRKAEEYDHKPEEQRFYIPKQRRFMDIDTSSPHVWPVNGVMINELLRRNTNDHLIDVLRAARKMLDRISTLHNTPTLIPTDELKTHIDRLTECRAICRRQRITHHANAIHPLQTTFEDLIEQFTYELRIFSGRSITAGHKSQRMILVSRFLRIRMDRRDRALALLSPRNRRVLMKLLALRMFIDLVERAGQENNNPFAETPDDFKDSDSDASEHASPLRVKPGVDAFAEYDPDAIGKFERGEEEGLADDADDAAEHQANLAELLAANKTNKPDEL